MDYKENRFHKRSKSEPIVSILKQSSIRFEKECAICTELMVEPCSLKPYCIHSFCI